MYRASCVCLGRESWHSRDSICQTVGRVTSRDTERAVRNLKFMQIDLFITFLYGHGTERDRNGVV